MPASLEITVASPPSAVATNPPLLVSVAPLEADPEVEPPVVALLAADELLAPDELPAADVLLLVELVDVGVNGVPPPPDAQAERNSALAISAVF